MKAGRFFKISGLLAAALMLLASCAAEIGDIDRTEPNKVKKSDLKGIWFYQVTAIEAPVPNSITFDGEMAYMGGYRVIFDIQEDYLFVYPVTELWAEGADADWHTSMIRNYWDEGKSDEFLEMYVGQPVAAFEIVSHFDVIRKYNPQTGEQSNILIEDEDDNLWHEREYVRVNWSKNDIEVPLFMMGAAPEPVDYYVQEFEEDSPDRFELTEDALNFVNKVFMKPMSQNCNLFGLASYDCAGAVVKIRNSFLKVDPNNDYIPLHYAQATMQEKFGFFLTERFGYDVNHGIKYSDNKTFINRWNLWTDSRTKVDIVDPDSGNIARCLNDTDCEGLHDGQVHCWLEEGWFSEGHCVTWDTVAPHNRGVQPILYHLSASWPEEYMRSAYVAADEFSRPFKDAVAWTQFYSEKGWYDVKYCETNEDCLGDTAPVLDRDIMDTHARFCDADYEKSVPPSERLCNVGLPESQWVYQYCASGVCAAKATCNSDAPCPMGQACIKSSAGASNGVCHECTTDNCDLGNKNDAGWAEVVKKTMDRGSYSMYWVEGGAGPEFRLSADDPVPFMELGQTQVVFMHLARDIGEVRLVDDRNGAELDDTCLLPAGGTFEGASYQYASDPGFCNANFKCPAGQACFANACHECTNAAGCAAEELNDGWKKVDHLIQSDFCMLDLGLTDDDKPVSSDTRTFSVVDVSSGATIATYPFGVLKDKHVQTFVLVGNQEKAHLLMASSEYDDVNTNRALAQVRFVHGVPGGGAVDFGLDASMRFDAVGFGEITKYTGLTQENNRVIILPAGTHGEVSCFSDNGVGMCMGWRQELTEADLLRVEEIEASLPELFVICENIYSGDSCSEAERTAPKGEKLAMQNDCRYWYEDDAGELRNPCAEVIAPHEGKNHGDLRYSQFYWVSEDQASSPLGYGPSQPDPVTGQIYYGIANIYGGVMISYGQYGKDLLDLSTGKLPAEDIATGKYIKEYIEHNHNYDGAYESLYAPLGVDTEKLNKYRKPVKRFWYTEQEMSKLKGFLASDEFREIATDRAKFMKKNLETLPPSMSAEQMNARFNRVRGTWLEDMMITEEVKNIGTGGTMNPDFAVAAGDMNALSPLNWADPEKIMADDNRLKFLAEHNYYSRELVEPYVYGTAIEVQEFCQQADNLANYGGEEETCQVRRITELMLDGVLQHEIGHTVGLRHNFEASSDLFNYHDEFYSIRDLDYRPCYREGPMSCVFGQKCRMFCQDDSFCMPGTSCQEVEVMCEQNSDCLPYDPNNDYWALKDADGNVTLDFKTCYVCSDEGLCVVKENAAAECPGVNACVNQYYEPTGACWAKQKTYEECTSDTDCGALDGAVCQKKDEELWGRCATRAVADDKGVCLGGYNAGGAGDVCRKDDSCDADAGKCKFDAARECADDDDCQVTYQPVVTESADMELVKMFVPRGYLTPDEAEKGRIEYQYSSIMDYGGTINFDVHGLGKYDKAALRYGYTELADIWTDTSKIKEIRTQMAVDWGLNELVWAGWLTDPSYLGSPFFFHAWLTLSQFIGVKENLERVPAPYRKIRLERQALNSEDRGVHDLSYHEVPYIYSGDEWRGNYMVYIFDVGADILEVLYHSWSKLQEYYVFDAFKRERWGAYRGADPTYYFSRILSRWFPPLQDAGRFNALYSMIFRANPEFMEELYSDSLMWGYREQSARTALRMCAELLYSPAPGSYRLEGQGTANERYVNVSYDMGAEGSELDIPLGPGKFPYTAFFGDAGYYYFDHAAWIGSFWEKLAALHTLTFSTGYFLSDSLGEQVDIGVGSSIGFNTNYYTPLSNTLVGFISGDRQRYSPYLDDDGSMRPFDPLRPQVGMDRPRIESSLEGLSMKTYVSLWAYSYVTSGFDNGIVESLFICLKGNGSCYDIATVDDFPGAEYAVETVEFTDPWSLKTYVAKTTNFDPERIDAAYLLLHEANELVAEWDAIEWGETEELDVQKDQLGKEIHDMVELLDVLYAFNELYGTLSY